MDMYLWAAAVGVAMLLAGYFWGSRSKVGELMKLTSERDVLQSKVDGAAERIAAQQTRFERQTAEQKEGFERQTVELKNSFAQQLAEQKATHEQVLVREKERGNEVKESFEKQLRELRQTHDKQIESLKLTHDQQIKTLREMNQKQVEDQLHLIQEQMISTSEKVLKQRQEELGERNKEQVSQIIDPLQDSLKQMQKALEDSKERQNETMTRLDETIRLNTAKSERLGNSADRLYNALTSEVKVQGNFGELQLRQLLENLGLKEGEQFTSQAHLRDKKGNLVKDDEGKGLIPDFVLHFPNNRHVVVDSKMSFTAYERYMNSDSDEERREHLKAHIASVRAQVERLSRKQYAKYLPDGCNQLDFAIMYINIEGALTLALSNDAELWRDAYDKGVLIFGAQTMFMNLRVLELMWRQVRQLHNQEEMVDAANAIIERVQIFAERFIDVETKLESTMRSVQDLKISTAESGKSIVTAAKRLLKAGAQENKKKKGLNQLEEVIYLDSDVSDYLLEAPEKIKSSAT